MDTAARILLKGRSIVLLTAPTNAGLFEYDPVFESVFTSWREASRIHQATPFDLVILDSFSPRSLAQKLRIAKWSPFVGLYGYLNAYEVHRSIFSFRRMETLLGLASQASVFLTHGLNRAKADGHAQSQTAAICIGGEWAFRTYDQWEMVIQGLVDRNWQVVLLGSKNGVQEARVLAERFPEIRNFVGLTSLSEACELLSGCRIFLGADGGLWHLASACKVPSIALHADCHLYDEQGRRQSRAPDEPNSICLQADNTVTEISSEKILEVFDKMVAIQKS